MNRKFNINGTIDKVSFKVSKEEHKDELQEKSRFNFDCKRGCLGLAYALIAMGIFWYLCEMQIEEVLWRWLWAIAWAFVGLVGVSLRAAMRDKKDTSNLNYFVRSYFVIYPFMAIIIGTLSFVIFDALDKKDWILDYHYSFLSAAISAALSLWINRTTEGIKNTADKAIDLFK